MLRKLGDHIKNCLEEASEAGNRAKEISEPGLKVHFLNLEKAWLCLARSFMQCERIERLLISLSRAGAAEWLPISSAPFDRDLELAVINSDAPHALAFPCRRIVGSWINTETKERLHVYPTHWREWRTRMSRRAP
jgi:hypothetical protein